MIHSLYYKFILGYLLFGLLGFAAIATLSSDMTYDYLVEHRAEALYDEANLIAENCSDIYQGKRLDPDMVKPQIDAMASYLQSSIWVVNHDGQVTVDSQNRLTGKTIDSFDPTAGGSKPYSIGTYYGQFSSDVLSVSAPITGNFNTYGYIVIHLPMKLITEEQNSILNIMYITAAILFGLSLIILLFFTKTVYVPLKKITYAATEYAAGNLSYSISLHTQDEMGYLANTLNYMAMELNKMEEYQHKFIANVSHDFRSPLTSIKGYLEAIIDGTIPPELYEKYLNIVIAETERLNKLTQGMLTLNSLDSKGFLTR